MLLIFGLILTIEVMFFRRGLKLLFAAMLLSTLSCQKRNTVECVYEEAQCDCVWINDTNKECTIKWFYNSGKEEKNDIVQISAGERYMRKDWYNHQMLYNAKRISVSFSGESEYLTENPNRVLNGGWNWWDSLPKTTHDAMPGNPNGEVRTFYLSDVWDIAVMTETIL